MRPFHAPDFQNFCVFDYPGYSLRTPPYAENYLLSTSIKQWLRKSLRGADVAPSSLQGLPTTRCSIEHPLLVFRKPVRDVHVTLEDVSKNGEHFYRKKLWDAHYHESREQEIQVNGQVLPNPANVIGPLRCGKKLAAGRGGRHDVCPRASCGRR